MLRSHNIVRPAGMVRLFLGVFALVYIASFVLTPITHGYTFNNRGYFNNANVGPATHASILPWMAGSCSFAGFGGPSWGSIAGNYSDSRMAMPLNQSGGVGGNKAQFRSFLAARYNNNGCSGWERMGVVFIVRTMLNDPVGSSMSLSAADWSRFDNLIVNNPLINMSYTSSGVNSGNNSGAGGYGGAGGVRDDYFYIGNNHTEPEYTFSGPGYTYRLKLRCANPTGYIGDTPPSPSTPADIRTRTSVNGTTGGTVYLDPSESADIYAWNTAANYNGMNHWTTTVVDWNVDGAGWQQIHTGSYTVNANGNRSIWGTYAVGYNESGIGRDIPDTASEVCYRSRITAAGGATIVGSSPSASSCVRFRAGETTASAIVDPIRIEPGEYSDMTLRMNTGGFPNTAPDPGLNYTVDCTYTFTISPGSFGGANGSLDGATSGDCDTVISDDGTINVFTRRYQSTATTPIGTEVCLTIQLTASDFVTQTNPTPGCVRVVAKPYVTVTGGDVVAGSAFETGGNCTVGAHDSAIAGWPGVSNNAAGTTLAAFSNGLITGFATAKATSPPSRLAFANTSTGGETYGGAFNSVGCIADHWGSRPALPGGTVGNIQTYQGSGTFNPAVIPPAGRTIQVGTQKTLYVDDDMMIRGNILYANRGSWTSIDQIPGVKFVVRGDIFIDKSVTELNGIYVAQERSDGTGGNIYTCANATGSGSPITNATDAAGYYAECDTPLRVNGIFSAKKIHLLRTGGTARAGTTPAEQFFYLPELWLAQWPSDNTGSGLRYDSITSLPPVL